MDLFKTSQIYFNKLFDPTTISILPGSNAKVLLLDQYTTSVISMCFTQSQLLSQEVVLIDLLQNKRDKLNNLTCIVYIKPCETSFVALLSELRDPHYKSYQVYFNNSINKTQLERLAESDDLELISRVVELFQDYLIYSSDLFMVNAVFPPTSARSVVVNNSSSLISVLLSLKKLPVVKYETNSRTSKQLANEMLFQINKESVLFDFGAKTDSTPILLILDRKNDPITPLLIPWTYQSMIHEFLGIDKNIVDLSQISNVSKDLAKITLNSQNDQFYQESMYLNFGDLTDKIKTYVSSFKNSKQNVNLNSLEDMKKFLANFPDFKKLSTNVSKHLTLVSELDNQINARRLWEISELEQNISSDSDSQSNNLANLHKLLNDESTNDTPDPVPILPEYKIKLVLLYCLRYDSAQQTNQLLNVLKQKLPAYHQQISQIPKIVKYCKITKTDDSLFNKATSTILPGFKSNHQVDNIYMQHIPKLENIILKQTRQKNNKDFVSLVPDALKKYYNENDDKVQDLIIYFNGGVTYEEARCVENLNSLNKNIRIVVGGDYIHNSSSFMMYMDGLVAEGDETVPSHRDLL